MADIESSINIDINTNDALANLRDLQRQISTFQQAMSKTGAVSTAQLSNMQQNLVNNINSTGQFSASIQKVATTTESFTRALEKNQFSMGQYFKYAGASTKTFGKLFRNEFDTIEKVARERVKTLQTQYIKLGRDANGAMQAISVRPQVLDMKDLGTQTAITAQKAQLFNQLMKQGSTELLNFGKNTQWAGRQLMVGFTIPLGIMGAAAAKEFQKIEEQVIRLQRVYGDFTTTVGDTQAITDQIKGLANEFTRYGVAVDKTIGLAADAAAMGKTGADLVAQVSEANRLAVLGGVDQKQSLETTISLTNAFGVSADKLSSKINFLNAVENQTVTSIQDMTTAIPIAAPVVEQLGGKIEDLTFFLTAMKEGGINASEGANALKSGLASIINPTTEATDMLNSFGISIQDIVQKDNGNVKQMILDVAGALNSLDPLKRAQAIETMFGKFQFSRMSTLFKNVTEQGGQAAKVLDLTKASASELAAMSEKELSKISASPLYQFQGAVERFQAAMAPLGETFMKAVTPIINFGTDILNKFNEMGDGAKQFWVILTGAVAGLGPILLMTFGLVANGVANIIKGFMAVKNIFTGAGKSSNLLAEQINYMTTEQLNAEAVAVALGQVHTNLIGTFNAEATSVKNLATAYGTAIAAQGQFMGPIVSGRGTRTAKKMATGGILRGPGNGTSDSIPAMLSTGEAVIPAENVKKFPGMVAALISGKIPGFASGTVVTKQDYLSDAGDNRRRVSISGHVDRLTAAGYGEDAHALLASLADANVSVGEARRIMSRLSQTIAGGADAISGMFTTINTSLDNWNRSGSKKSKELVAAIDDVTGATVSRRERARQVGQFTHIGAGVTMSAREYMDKFGTHGLNQGEIVDLERLIRENKTLDVKSGLGMAGFDPNVNRAMASEGTSKADLKRAFSAAGLQKWNQSVKLGGGNVDNLSGSIKKFDDKLKSLINQVKAGTTVFDTRAQAETFMAKNAGKLAVSFEELYSEAVKTADPQLQQALYTAHTTAREVRLGASARRQKVYPSSVSGVLVSQADAELAGGTVEAVQEKKTRKRKLDAEKVQADIAEKVAKKQGREYALNSSGSYYDPETGYFLSKDEVKRRKKNEASRARYAAAKQARAQAILEPNAVDAVPRQGMISRVRGAVTPGRMAGAGFIATAGLGMLSSVGGPVGEAASSMTGPLGLLSTSAMMLSMFPNQVGLVLAALTAVTGGIMLLVGANEEHRKKIKELNDAMTITTSETTDMSKAFGTVSATEIARQGSKGMISALATGGKQTSESQAAAQQYIGSDAGKKLMAEANTMIANSIGSKETGKILGDKIAYAILQGVISADQGQAIATEIGKQLSDYTISANISGEITSIVGKDGKDLAKAPSTAVARMRSRGEGNQIGAFKGLSAQAGPGGNGGVFNSEDVQKVMGQGFAQLQVNASYLDILKQQYEVKKQQATTQEEINQIEQERNAAVLDAQKKNSKYYDTIKKQLNELYAAGNQDQITNTLNNSFVGQFQAGSAEANRAQNLVNGLGQVEGTAKTSTQQITVAISTAMGSGQLSLDTATALVEAGQSGEQKQIDYVMNFDATATAQGAEYASTLDAMMRSAGFDQGQIQKAFMISADATVGPEAKTLLDMFTAAGDSQSVDLVLSLMASGDSAGVAKLKADIDSITSYFADGKHMAVDVVAKFSSLGFDLTAEQAAYFDSLPAAQQKDYVSAYLTVLETIDLNTAEGRQRLRDWATSSEGAGSQKAASQKYTKKGGWKDNKGRTYKWDYSAILKDMAGSNATSASVATGPTAPDNPPPPGGGGGSSAPDLKAPTQTEQYSAALNLISKQEEQINKLYDERLAALDSIQKAQEAISQQQKDQLDLAEALTKGDIGAAARAAQTIRANDATRALEAQKSAIEAARKAALSQVTYGGHTREWYQSQIDAIDAAEQASIAAGTPRATGGYISGAGTGTSDSIPAMLSNGEYVIRAAAVKALGLDRLDALNNADRLKFASGGLVPPLNSLSSSLLDASQKKRFRADSLSVPSFNTAQGRPRATPVSLEAPSGNASNATQNNSVYNYSISVNAPEGSDTNQIAQSVMQKIKSMEQRQVRGNYING